MAEISHGKNDPFNDKKERTALRTFLAENKSFQDFWTDYFGNPKNTTIKDDPLGKYKVDLGIVDRDSESQIHGLIEVDVFNSWEEKFPPNYKKFHVLERKLRYFQETDYKYLTCTFNRDHTQMCCTTKDNIEKCLDIYGITNMWIPKIQEYDLILRCPLDENILWFRNWNAKSS